MTDLLQCWLCDDTLDVDAYDCSFCSHCDQPCGSGPADFPNVACPKCMRAVRRYRV